MARAFLKMILAIVVWLRRQWDRLKRAGQAIVDGIVTLQRFLFSLPGRFYSYATGNGELTLSWVFTQAAQWIFGWTLIVVAVAALAYMLSTKVQWSESEMRLYFNSAAAFAWFNGVLMLIFLIALDWRTPKNTVMTLLDVDRKSTWQDRAIAAFTLVGLTFAFVYAIKP